MPDSVLNSEDANQVLAYVLDQINEPEVFSQKVQTVFADPNSNTFDTLHLEDGRILEVYSRPQKLEDKMIGRVWAFRDVTAHKKTEETLKEKQHMNNLLLNSMPYPIMLINKARIVMAANKIALDNGVKIGGYCWKNFGKCVWMKRQEGGYLNPFSQQSFKAVAWGWQQCMEL